jgi:hypothetical protein
MEIVVVKVTTVRPVEPTGAVVVAVVQEALVYLR